MREISRRELYAMGEPLGECVTRKEAGRIVCGGGGGSSQKTEIPKELRPLATQFANKAMQIGNNAYTPFTGQRFAPLAGDQTSAMSMIRNRALGGDPVMNQANQTMMQTLQGGQTNPYLNSMVDQAQQSVARNYNMFTKPQTESAMVNSGSFGNSGLLQMQQEQQRQASEQMGNIATQMYGQAYDQDRARQMQALGMAPTYGNQAYQDAAQLLNSGALQQANKQQGLDFNYQQFAEAREQPYKNLQAMGLPFGSNMGSTTKTSQGMGGADWAALAGTAAMLFFSDRRMKEDVKKVGTTDDGLPIYTYKYKSGGPTQMGVMAQDLQKKKPDAVHNVGGLLAVDYSKVS